MKDFLKKFLRCSNGGAKSIFGKLALIEYNIVKS